MKVASTKYEVALSIITILMLENMYMHQIVFMTAIDTMLFFCEFYRNFDELWIFCKKFDTGNWNPN